MGDAFEQGELSRLKSLLIGNAISYNTFIFILQVTKHDT